MEKISIIVPCYNAEKNIEKCILSLKKQDYNNFEVLLIDDGSKDKTKLIVKKLIKDDKRFIYKFKKNGGVSSARNLGIKMASGEFICFLDSDDWVENNYLSSLYNTLKKDNSSLAACNFKRIYKDKITYNKINCNIDLLKYTAPWNKIYRKNFFEQNKIYFPENIWYEDVSVSVKTYMLAKKVAIDNNYLHNYIQNDNSLVHTYDNRIFDIYKIIEDIEEFAKSKKIYKKYYSDIEFLCIYHILVGTVFRASFHKDFNFKMIHDIVKYVEDKYPNWNNNSYIKNLPFYFRVYLFFIKKHLFNVVKFFIKKLNKIVKI